MPAKRILTEQEQVELRSLFHTGSTTKEISDVMRFSYRVIMNYWRQWFSEEEFHARKVRLDSNSKQGDKNPMYGRSGTKHHAFKKMCITTQGYISVEKPDWWTGKSVKPNRVAEHILVCCQKHGLTALPKGYVVHHKDENRHNNSADNLELMSVGEHLRLHNTTHGKYVKKSATTIPNGSSVQENTKRTPTRNS